MRWQRGARLLMAAIGVSCAAAVYYYSRSGESRPAAPPPTVGQLADPQATSEASAGKVTRLDFKANKDAYALEFAHSATYPDGHSRYETVRLTSRRGDREFNVWSDVAEEHGKSVTGDNPGVVNLTGHVRVETSDGLRLDSDTASYEDASGMARIPGHLTFSRGRLSGESVGAVYNRETDVLLLSSRPHVIMAPDPSGGGAIDATAASMEVARTARYIRLQDQARIERDRETLSSDLAVLHLTQDESGVELIEMRGHSTVIPRGPAAGGPPDMRATDINLGFRPDGRTMQRATLTGRASLIMTNDTGRRTITGGWIDVLPAPDGQTLQGLEARDHVVVTLPATADTPARTITAPTLVAQGNDQGLQSAVFNGGIQFIEVSPAKSGQPAVNRTGTSASLALVLKGQLDAIEEADFRDDVKFKDDDVSAAAGLAKYFATKNQLWLSPLAGSQKQLPSVTEGTEQDGAVRIDGQMIKLDTVTHDLDATGNVSTRMLPSRSKTTSTRSPALFEEGKEVDGTAPTVHYVSQTRRAKYNGGDGIAALVWQDQNVVKADEVEFEQDTGNLRASGNVESTFLLDSAPAKPAAGASASDSAKPSKSSATAATMVYSDAERRAIYTGVPAKPATVMETDGKVAAQRVELILAKEQRSLERMIATVSVYAEFEGGRQAAGDRLTYDAVTDAHVLTGKPAKVKAPQTDKDAATGKETTTCTLHKGTTLKFQRSGGVTGEGDGALVSQTKMNCTDSVK